MPRKQIEWIRKKAPYEGLSDCIICTSHRPNSHGYPQIVHEGRNTTINRVVCKRRNRSMGSLFSLHSCDRRMCINPDHIRPGTRSENTQDCVSRGRNRTGRAKLTPEQAMEVFNSVGTIRSIGSRFGISSATVHDIKTKKNWSKIHDCK